MSVTGFLIGDELFDYIVYFLSEVDWVFPFTGFMAELLNSSVTGFLIG